MTGPHDDIINLPHHVSTTRPRMSMESRAAQFSPFAALTGHDAAVRETARLTGTRIELEEDAKAAIELKLRLLADAADSHPEVAVTHFRPDKKKEGGAYVTSVGGVKKIDDFERRVVLLNGEKIAFGDITDIECELFKDRILFRFCLP